jgi:outer membrane protein assembly factor BamB
MNDKRAPRSANAIPAEILAEFDIPGVTQIHGVTFDGTHIWFAGSTAKGDDLHCVDPTTGKLVRRLGRTDCSCGLAFDGKHLWQVCADGLHQIDRQTGRTLRKLPPPEAPELCGLAYHDGCLWVGSFGGRRILKLDLQTGAVLATIPSDRLVTGVTWIGNELWHGTYPEADDDDAPGELRAVDSTTGAVRKRVHVANGTRISGTEYDGHERIWFGARRGGRDSLQAVRKA